MAVATNCWALDYAPAEFLQSIGKIDLGDLRRIETPLLEGVSSPDDLFRSIRTECETAAEVLTKTVVSED